MLVIDAVDTPFCATYSREHRPIRYQLPAGLSFRQGQGHLPLMALLLAAAGDIDKIRRLSAPSKGWPRDCLDAHARTAIGFVKGMKAVGFLKAGALSAIIRRNNEENVERFSCALTRSASSGWAN
jgi:hypothetical protein